MLNTHVVIMAGGSGKRLWPLSTVEEPKQFIDILGVGKSMIQLTVERFDGVCRQENFWVVTSERYVEEVKKHLPWLSEQNILAEPEPRNTAPCIAYACKKIAKRFPDANIVVTPSDAIVLEPLRFRSVILKALKETEISSKIITIGIAPSRPEVGYGYIRADDRELDQICKVLEFKEKPNRETAEKYISDGNYFWNAGIFVWNVSTINFQLKEYAPAISSIMDELSPYLYTDKEKEKLKELFPKCDKISIDYAVMEKSKDIFVIPTAFGWSDLGNWSSVRSNSILDENGNSIIGNNVNLIDSKDCVIHTSNLNTVIINGLNGYMVVEKDRNLIIYPLDREQEIKDYLEKQL